MKRALIWFTNDLRLIDNETIIRAVEENDEVIPVYCWDEAYHEATHFESKKTGKHRKKFLLESIFDLDYNLRNMGSGLLIVFGKPEIEIAKLAVQYGTEKVYTKGEIAYDELKLQQTIKVQLQKLRCELITINTCMLNHPSDLPFAIKDISDIFTNFRKEIEKNQKIRNEFEKPSHINSPFIPKIESNVIGRFEFSKTISDNRSSIKFKGGESEAWKRLNHYFFETKSLSKYKETRNGLVGADYSSKLSVWLANGCLSAKSIYHQVKKYEKENTSNESTYWLIFELLWRDYFRYSMMKYGHNYFMRNGIKSNKILIKTDDLLFLQKWKNGETGNEFIDSNMLELKHTGFMSNRGRQNVASYFCEQSNSDWRLGAAYFEQELIDYDVCSNWGNWAYLAGVGNDPRPSRIFNIEKQAEEYDKDKKHRELWLGKL